MSDDAAVSFVSLDELGGQSSRPSTFRRNSSIVTDILPKYKKRNALFCIPVFVIFLATLIFVIVIYGKQGFRTEKEEIEETAAAKNYSLYRASRHGNLPNVLFIVVDDLRPTLSCYGDPIAITPNIDQLAGRGFLFTNAYAQQAFCAPSRTSLLTSRRPDSTHLYDEGSYWRDTVGNFTTLPQHFKESGYHTISVGKVFHKGRASNNTDDYPYSWSNIPFHPLTDKYKMAKVCPTADGQLHANLNCPVDVKLQPLGTLPDIESTKYSIEFLQNYSNSQESTEKPFFLGIGYHKPHIPFKFPKEYLDLYPISSMTLAPNPTIPRKLPSIAWAPWTDVRNRDDISKRNVPFPYGPLPDDLQKFSRQGYYASVSFIDDLIGQLLQALDETGLSNNTMVVLFGDHGWSLGEHQEWAKYSNFDVSLRVPLIITTPQFPTTSKPFKHIPLVVSKVANPKHQKQEINSLTELVDIFPTLSELSGLAIPSLCPEKTEFELSFCSEGVSLVPLLANAVVRGPRVSWKSAAFSQYPRPSEVPQFDSDSPALKDIWFMGYTMRTEQYRYTEWVAFDHVDFSANWSDVHARELYWHVTDPREDDNLADDPKFQGVIQDMANRLHKGWRNALPKSHRI